MDALYDDSDIFNFEYSITDMGTYSKKLEVQVYRSDVEHPMSTKYRVVSGATDSNNEVISDLRTTMQGAKIKNLMEVGEYDLTLGLDVSRRNWDGKYIKHGIMSAMITGRKSIDDVDTDNRAFFTSLEKSFGKLDVEIGGRYDDTEIDHGGDFEDKKYKF